MARGMFTSGRTREEAERTILAEHPDFEIVDARKIDLSDIRSSTPLGDWWALAVEGGDPTLPQDDDPLGTAERAARDVLSKVANDPEALQIGSIEEFNCPACGRRIRIEMPGGKQARLGGGVEAQETEHTSCPECQASLSRVVGQLTWRARA
jgi:hypothetical protein